MTEGWRERRKHSDGDERKGRKGRKEDRGMEQGEERRKEEDEVGVKEKKE